MANDRWKLELDFQEIFKQNIYDFKSLNGSRIFLIGGTVFIGTWLLR